jgi:hypothetical protein
MTTLDNVDLSKYYNNPTFLELSELSNKFERIKQAENKTLEFQQALSNNVEFRQGLDPEDQYNIDNYICRLADASQVYEYYLEHVNRDPEEASNTIDGVLFNNKFQNDQILDDVINHLKSLPTVQKRIKVSKEEIMNLQDQINDLNECKLNKQRHKQVNKPIDLDTEIKMSEDYLKLYKYYIGHFERN